MEMRGNSPSPLALSRQGRGDLVRSFFLSGERGSKFAYAIVGLGSYGVLSAASSFFATSRSSRDTPSHIMIGLATNIDE